MRYSCNNCGYEFTDDRLLREDLHCVNGKLPNCKGTMSVVEDLISEQRPPKPSDGDVWLLVLKDMEERRKHGIEKYGTPLQPFNGRDPLIDGYQEALDLCVYLRQAIEEIRTLKSDNEHMRNGLTRIRKVIENGEEWSTVSAGSLHLMVAEALEERKK